LAELDLLEQEELDKNLLPAVKEPVPSKAGLEEAPKAPSYIPAKAPTAVKLTDEEAELEELRAAMSAT
jgi:hypothetical protein